MVSFHRRVTLAMCLLVAGCGGERAAEPVVSEAWVRLPGAAGRPGAAYFTITGAREPARLLAIETPLAERVEMHASGMAGGRMTMRRLDGVAVAPDAKVAFAPGGNHAMLFGIDRTAWPGGTVRMTFRFERGTAVTTEAKLVGAGDDAPY